MTMLHSLKTKLGFCKQAPRIWLNNPAQLNDAGFKIGSFFNVTSVDENEVIIEIAEAGRVVSQKNGNPLIDVNNRQLSQIGNKGDILVAKFYEGKIIVTIHPLEQAIKEREASFKAGVKSGKLTHSSFFTGGGMMDYAIHEAFKSQGIELNAVFANEIEQNYLDTTLAHNPALKGARSVGDSIDFLHLYDIPKSHVASAGWPCPPLSIAGRVRNGNKTAFDNASTGHVFISLIANLLRTQASLIILENVPQAQDDATTLLMERILKLNGYEVQRQVESSYDFGSIERRKRMVMVAFSKGIEIDLDQLEATGSPLNTLGDYLDKEVDPSRWSEMTGLKAKQIRDKEAGKSFAMQIFNEESSYIGTLTSGIAKNRSTDPKIQHPENPDLLRIPTAEEHARIKGYPIEIFGDLSQTVKHQVLGNGVSFGLFFAVGRLIAGQVKSWAREAEQIVQATATAPTVKQNQLSLFSL